MIRLFYRDVDRTPYLHVLRQCARQHGLDVEVARGGFTREHWEDELAAGTVDILAENYWGLQVQAAQGAPWIAIGGVADAWPDRLLADDSVRTIDDLRGKRLAVRGLGPQEHLPRMWLQDNGLAGQVEQLVYPEKETGRWGHWKKVADGTCQACFVSVLYVDPALAAGLHEIPLPAYGYVGNVTLVTSEQTLARHREDLQKLIDAAFDASRLFHTDRGAVLKVMRGEARELVSQQLDLSSEERLERLYDGLRAELADAPLPTPEAIGNTRRMLLHVAPELHDYNTLAMWDFSFAREALKKRRG